MTETHDVLKLKVNRVFRCVFVPYLFYQVPTLIPNFVS